MSDPTFAVVIPMFNECSGAECCVVAVDRVLDEIAPETRLIVVDDGSEDGTGRILARLATEHPRLTVVTQVPNQGYGRALQAGAGLAGRLGLEWVLFMDSDLTNDPADIPAFAEAMRKGFDLIKASRYMPGGDVGDVPPWRVWISKAGNRLARFLFGLSIHDLTNGFRAIRTDVVNEMPLTESRFPAIMEELYWATTGGCSIAEIPVRLRDRAPELRPSSFAYKPDTFYRYFKYCWKAWIRRMGTSLSRTASKER